MSFFYDLKISTRLYLLVALFLTSIGGVSLLSIHTLSEHNEAFLSQHEDHLLPVDLVSKIRFLMGENRSHAILLLQHDPKSSLASKHDHKIDFHTGRIRTNVEEIGGFVTEFETKHVFLDHCEGDPKGSIPQEYCDEARKEGKPQTEKEAYEEWKTARTAFVKEGLEPFISAIEKEDFEKAGDLLLTKINPLYATASDKAKYLEHLLIRVGKIEFDEAENKYETARKLIFVILASSTLISIAFSALIIVSIKRQVSSIEEATTQMSVKRDFRIKLQTPPNEIGCVASGLQNLADTLRTTFAEFQKNADAVRGSADNVSCSAKEIGTAANDLAERNSRLSGTVEEFTAGNQSIAQSAREAVEIGETSKKAASEGTRLVAEAVGSISQVETAFASSATEVQELSQKSQKVGGIVGTIKEIADQTNLLALNAAIEAARAGEQGRGFAVVADEVRKLAERTSKATQEISGIVGSIQSDIGGTTDRMTENGKLVRESVRLAENAGTAIETLASHSQETAGAVTNINDVLQEQQSAAGQISRITEDNAATSEETAAATVELSRNADQLRQLADEMQKSVSKYVI